MIDDNHIKQKFNSNQIHNSKIKSLNNDELNYLTNIEKTNHFILHVVI